jgi:hypothetical protein
VVWAAIQGTDQQAKARSGIYHWLVSHNLVHSLHNVVGSCFKVIQTWPFFFARQKKLKRLGYPLLFSAPPSIKSRGAYGQDAPFLED